MRNSSIYVHFPYCLRKCNYCDFVSYPCAGGVEDLASFYMAELEAYYARFGRRAISSIYFGGGTPSLMSVESFECIIEKICSLYDVANDAEITLEVNPKTVNEVKLRDFALAGVNRISLGMQSFDDEELQFLGRVHTVAEARETLVSARKYFDNVSCDFIYALPGQSFEKWQANLEKIAALDVQHLSLYQLIIEPKTPIYSLVKRGEVKPLSEGVSRKMFLYTNKFLRDKFPQYEISNYAKSGFYSRHNLNYWNGGDYIGIGPSAAGRIFCDGRFFASENTRLISEWKENVKQEVLSLKPLSKQARAEEILIMGLRKNKGIDFSEFQKNSCVNFMDMLDVAKVNLMVSKGFLCLGKNFVRVTAKGRAVLDAVIREIIK